MYAQIIGSMRGYISSKLPEGTHAYYDKVPEELQIPSVYYQQLITNDLPKTKDSYSLMYTMRVHFFYATEEEAMQVAESIANEIRANRYQLHLVNFDGSESENTIKFTRVTTAPIGTGTAQLTMIFEYQQAYIN